MARGVFVRRNCLSLISQQELRPAFITRSSAKDSTKPDVDGVEKALHCRPRLRITNRQSNAVSPLSPNEGHKITDYFSATPARGRRPSSLPVSPLRENYDASVKSCSHAPVCGCHRGLEEMSPFPQQTPAASGNATEFCPAGVDCCKDEQDLAEQRRGSRPCSTVEQHDTQEHEDDSDGSDCSRGQIPYLYSADTDTGTGDSANSVSNCGIDISTDADWSPPPEDSHRGRVSMANILAEWNSTDSMTVSKPRIFPTASTPQRDSCNPLEIIFADVEVDSSIETVDPVEVPCLDLPSDTDAEGNEMYADTRVSRARDIVIGNMPTIANDSGRSGLSAARSGDDLDKSITPEYLQRLLGHKDL